ncbi:UDP-glucuronosyltransferase 2C1-like [Synchiropus picturatus]
MSIQRECKGAAALLLVLLACTLCDGGKILIVPLEGSHWVNMELMIKALHARGHSVDVVRTNQSWYIKDDSPHYGVVTVPLREFFDQDFVNPILKKILEIERGESSFATFVSLQFEMFNVMYHIHRMVANMAATMMTDEGLMAELRERRYDLMLTDPAWGAGILLAHALELPLVFNVRWITSGEGHLVVAPSPLSYIPLTGSGLTDKMTFTERVKNTLFYLIWVTQDFFLINPHYQAVCDKFFSPSVQFKHLMQGADLWLMRVDFVFEFPRPIMPNMIYIGGFQCKPAEPLPDDLEAFVQSSGDDGVILMSLGTFVEDLPFEVSNKIAEAFAQLPQKIIWKHNGVRPTTLGNNTLLVDWMPQKDLLGHPKVKLFVAHGGTNGVQEAIYHGVPVVGIPLFYDQYDNLVRLKVRGAAKIVELEFIEKENHFLNAVRDVLDDPTYTENMRLLSRLHRDQPIKPLDHATFWVEFVMRHKGAAHLRTESYKLPWLSYYCLDLLLAFLTTVAAAVLPLMLIFRRTCMRAGAQKKPSKR